MVLGPCPLGACRWGGGCTKGPLFSSLDPQVRLEQIRQAESLEQVRSIMDEAPLRDIRDIKDS